ncbi:hypothetical protein [Flavobacterium humi]|uniref:Tox-MPTase4 domain-containing protein n=1 Tax=Flavobacterium humi TaxID=2562683 RepID=A0A4Z0L995_9FLAO|nr:hypothetical protein [Flavobacterium humi]TGD57563.1 hypothetical protein E4635_10250 [Flavobacterium humi]
MKPYSEILQLIQTYHELGETIQAANLAIEEYGIRHPNFKGFELREKAKPDYVLMTTEGTFGLPQVIRIPENTFEFEFILMLNLIAHEMIHVGQKMNGNFVEDRNEREWQAHYEMLFHRTYPQIPDMPKHQQVFFGNKALDYYRKMGEDSVLQEKYAQQKLEVENLVASLS